MPAGVVIGKAAWRQGGVCLACWAATQRLPAAPTFPQAGLELLLWGPAPGITLLQGVPAELSTENREEHRFIRSCVLC